MKQERRNVVGTERDRDSREATPEGLQTLTGREATGEEPRRFDGGVEDSFRGKSDGEILQRYEF